MSDPIALEFKEVEGAVKGVVRELDNLIIKVGAVNRADVGQITTNLKRLNQTSLQQLQTELEKLGKVDSSSVKALASMMKNSVTELQGMLTASGKSIDREWKLVAESTLATLRKQHAAALQLTDIHNGQMLVAQKQATGLALLEVMRQAAVRKQAEEAAAADRLASEKKELKAHLNGIAALAASKQKDVKAFSLDDTRHLLGLPSSSEIEVAMSELKKDILQRSTEAKAAAKLLAKSKTTDIKPFSLDDTRHLLGLPSSSEIEVAMSELKKDILQRSTEAAATAKKIAAAKLKQVVPYSLADTRNLFGLPSEAAMSALKADILARNAEVSALMRGSTGGVGSGKQYTANLPRAAAPNLMGVMPAPTASTLTASIPTPAHVASVNNLSTAFRKLTVDGNDVHSMARGLASGFNLLWLTWGNLLPLMAGSAISFGVKKTFDIGSEVEYQIKFIQLLGDLTKEQGSAIRQELRNIDQTTMFSMLELSKLMVTITQAGFSARDALELTKVSADLATVGMTTMDVSSKLLIQTMNLFPDSANNVSKTAAQIFQITKDSVLNVNQISGAMQYASTANIAYGQSLEDTLTIYGALAKAGITAQKAGTSYTNMLHDLYGRSGPAIKALKEIEAQTGKAIKQFDEMGKARPAIEIIDDIAKGLQLFTPEKAMKLTNAIFTERGIRSFFSALREGKSELVAYSEMLKELDPEVMFKTSRGLMDTTKGALEQLQGAFIGTLDQVFDSLSGRFKDAVINVRDYLSSADFGNLVYDMVNSIVSLYEGIVKVLPVIKAFGVAWLGFKTFSLVEAALFSTTKLLAPLTTSLGLATAKMGIAAGLTGPLSLGFHGTGVAMLASAAGSRAAAAGLGIVQIEAAKTAVTVTAAAGSTRLLALALGFMANPLVGIGVTLAMLGATWWMTSKESSTASQALSDKIFENGKVNAAVLENEIRLLNDRAAAAGSPQKTAIQELADAERAKLQLIQEKLTKELPLRDRRPMVTAALMREHAQVTANLRKLEDAADKHQSVLDKQEKDREAKRAEAARKAAEKLKSDYERTINGVNGTPGTPGRGPREAAIKDTNKWVKDNLAAITAGEQQKLAALSASFTKENELRTLYRDAGMLQEGAYQTNSLTAFHAYTAKRKDLLASSEEEIAKEEARVSAENVTVREAKLALITDKDKQAADKREAIWKEYEDGVQSLGEKAKADRERLNKERLATEEEYTKRITALGLESVKAVYLAEEEFKKSKKASAAEDDKSTRVEALSAAYSHVTEGATAAALAQKAAAEAGLQATFAMEAALAVQAELVNKQQMGADAVFNNVLELMQAGKEVPAELLNTLDLVEKALERSKALRNNVAEEGAKNIVSATSKAFNKVLTDDMLKFQRGFADAIETALFEGGEAGKKKLRDVIVAELRKPITLFIQASVKALFDGTGFGGVTNALGVGGQSGAMGAINTASSIYSAYGAAGAAGGFVGSLGSAATYGTAIGSQQGAMLAVQEMGMGTLAGGASSIGAALPYIGLALAAVALIDSLDDSGTMHTGGLGSYSKAGGSATGSAVSSQGLRFGVDAKDYTASSEQAAAAMAKAIAGMLDSTAATFGKEAGYYAATAFADDSSKDGAWGALMVKLGDKLLVDWGDNPSAQGDANVPRVFADGEAGAKEYAAAVAADVKTIIDGMELPDWAQSIADNVTGAAPSMETLASAMQQIAAMPEQVLQSIGTSTQALSGIIMQGMQAGDPIGAGAAFAGQITYGIEASLYNGFAEQITSIISTNLVTPIVTAMASGATITEAMSQASIDTMVAQVEAAGSALKAIVNNPALKDALAQVNTIISDAVASTVASVPKAPIAPPTYAPLTTATTNANDLSTAVKDLAKSFEDAKQALAETHRDLVIDLIRTSGDEAGARAMERTKYLSGFLDLTQAERDSLAVQYDKNQVLRDQITELGKLNGLRDEEKQLRIDEAMAFGDTAKALELMTAGMSEAQKAAYLANKSLSENIAAQNAHKDLERALLEAQGDTAAIRALELAALAPGNRALQERIWALEDEAAALEKMKGLWSAIDGAIGDFLSGSDLDAFRNTRIADQINDLLGTKLTGTQLASASVEDVKKATRDLVMDPNVATETKTAVLGLSVSLLGLKQSAVDAEKALLSTFDGVAAKFMSKEALKGFQLDRSATQINAALGTSLSAVQLDQATIGGIQQAVLGVALDNAVPPEARAAVLQLGASLIDLKQSALDAAKATAEAAVQSEKARLDQQTGLQKQIADLSGDKATLLAFRELEISQLDGPLNQSLQRYIYLLQDQAAALDAARTNTDKAYSAIERAVAAQRKTIETQRTAAQSLVSEISGIFDTLKSNVASLYDEVDSTRTAEAVKAQQTIAEMLANALATGALPESDALNAAISAARSGINATQYSSQAEADFARLVLAGELKDLQDISGTQLTTAEQQVKLAEDQLAALDQTLETARAQIDTLRGIDTSVISVEQAIANLAKALLGESDAAKAMGGAGASADYSFGPDAAKANYETLLAISKADDVVAANALAAARAANAAFDAILAGGTLDYMMGISPGAQAAINQAKLRSLPSFDVGTNFVPYDTLAKVHKGEMIVPAAYNPATSGVGNAKLERLVEGLTAEVQRLQAIVNDGNTHQRRTADTLENVTEGGANMRTVTT